MEGFGMSVSELAANTKAVLLRRQEVERRTGYAKSAIYSRMDPKSKFFDPTFPKPVTVGGTTDSPTAVRWVEAEIDLWIAARIEARDNRRAA
jgi:prophage regulatory protein